MEFLACTKSGGGGIAASGGFEVVSFVPLPFGIRFTDGKRWEFSWMEFPTCTGNGDSTEEIFWRRRRKNLRRHTEKKIRIKPPKAPPKIAPRGIASF